MLAQLTIIIDTMRYFWIILGLMLAVFVGACTAQQAGNNSNLLDTAYSSPGGVVSASPSQPVGPSQEPGSGARVNEIDGMTLIRIPSGTFKMGMNAELSASLCVEFRTDCSVDDFADEEPAHLVKLESYWIYQTEVTNAQYRGCVEDGSCPLPALLEFFEDLLFGDHPVVYVDWYAAQAYCEYARGRLPSEAEWEKAARGTDSRLFPWGNTAECGKGNLKGCAQGLTTPVGSFPEGASPYGVLDLAGNVSEWVADWYSPEYYRDSPPENPSGPTEGEMRVARGGSWKNPFPGVRSTNRTGNYPEVFSTGVGFRCVIEGVD